MPEFLVTTQEYVEGRYLVTAPDAVQAVAALHDRHDTDWERVEQVEYLAWLREVEGCAPV